MKDSLSSMVPVRINNHIVKEERKYLLAFYGYPMPINGNMGITKSKRFLAPDEHDGRGKRQSQLPQEHQISNNRSNQSSLGSAADVSDRVENPSDDHGKSEDCGGDGEVDSRDEVHDEAGGGELDEVVVGSLGVVELVPLLVGQLCGIFAVAHVGIPALLDLVSSGALVLLPEIGLHELFGKDLSPHSPWEEETDEQNFEGDEDSDE